MRLRGLLSRHAVALVAIALPSIAWLAPMLRDPAHTVIGWEGDNLFFIRQFWWVKHALVDLHRSPFFDPYTYWPFGYELARGELTLANTLTALPVTLLAGPIAAYNVMLLAGFLLTGWLAYAWVFRLGGSRGGAVVAAIVATMAPYRLARAPGHLNVISTQGFVLTLWAFEELVRSYDRPPQSRPPRRWALAVGAGVAVTALASWYSAYQLALLFPIYALVRTGARRQLWTAREWWKDIAAAAAVAAVLVLPVAVPYARAATHGEITRSFAEVDSWSLNFYDFVIPNAYHPLLNGFMTRAFPQETSQWAGRAVSLGYVAMALAAWGAVRTYRSNRYAVLAMLAVMIVSAAIALGPLLHSGDRQVLLPMPYLVTKTVDWILFRVRPMSPYRLKWWTDQVTPIPLPSLFLFMFVPGTAAMRAMSRFGYWTILMVAGLAGLGVRDVIGRAGSFTRGREVFVTCALALAVVFEFWSIRTLTRWEPRPVDRWIARQPAGDVVIELPMGAARRPAQDYYTTVQQHATIFGPIGDSFSPPILLYRWRQLIFPSDRAAALLRDWGTTLVILHDSMEPGGREWRTVLTRTGGTEVAAFDDVRVYRIAGPK